MDVIQMAEHVRLSDMANEIAGIDGHFGPGGEAGESAHIWLKNGYGVSITRGGLSNEYADTAELKVIREAHTPEGFVSDYSTPVTDDVVPGATVAAIAGALRTLSGLVNDPTDMRRSLPHSEA